MLSDLWNWLHFLILMQKCACLLHRPWTQESTHNFLFFCWLLGHWLGKVGFFAINYIEEEVLDLRDIDAFGIGCSELKQFFTCLFNQCNLFFVFLVLQFVCFNEPKEDLIWETPFAFKPFLFQILSFVVVNWQFIYSFFQNDIMRRVDMRIFIHFLNDLLYDLCWA